MATALSLTRNEMVQAALRKIGVLAVGETAGASEITYGSEVLNIILKNLDAAPWFKWCMKSDPWIKTLSSGVPLYTLDASVMWIERAVVSELEAESLDETAFTTHANWDVTGDIVDSGGNATYTHSTGVGTLTQVSGDMATAPVSNRSYLFNYTVSSAGTAMNPQVTTSFAANAVSLKTSDATHEQHIISAASASDFVISATSSAAAGNFVLDDVSLKQLARPEHPIELITVGEYASIVDKNRKGEFPQFAFMTNDLSTPKLYVWPVPDQSLAIKMWVRRKIDLLDSSSDTFDLPEEWYRPVVYLLALDLAPEYGVTLAERQDLRQVTMEALELAKQNQTQQIVGQEIDRPSLGLNAPGKQVNLKRVSGEANGPVR